MDCCNHRLGRQRQIDSHGSIRLRLHITDSSFARGQLILAEDQHIARAEFVSPAHLRFEPATATLQFDPISALPQTVCDRESLAFGRFTQRNDEHLRSGETVVLLRLQKHYQPLHANSKADTWYRRTAKLGN